MASTFFELDGEEFISSSLIIKELDFDQEIANIISQVFTDVEDIDGTKLPNTEFADQLDQMDLSKAAKDLLSRHLRRNMKEQLENPIEEADQWDIGDLSNNPVLLKMAGYCKGGTSDSYWAIYLSGIGCLIFDDPLTISEYCKLYLWDKDEEIFEWASDNTENEDLAKIKSLSDSNKNVEEIKIEFEKYQEWVEDELYVKSNFREMADKIKLNPDLESLKQDNEYIFDSDNSFDFDILSEISQIWPLKGRF